MPLAKGRTLGRSGLAVTSLALGTTTFATGPQGEEVRVRNKATDRP